MPRQAKSVAKTRLDLDHQANRSDARVAPPTIESVAVKLETHIDAAVLALGKAALEGDVQAAKAILDFVRAADQEEQGSKGKAMLDRVASIRGKRAGTIAERPLSP